MSPDVEPQRQNDVRRYYDNNTSIWERLGEGGAAIHRAIWAEGVTSRKEAFDYVDRLVAQQAVRLQTEAPRLLDLGCGIGASLINLAAFVPQATGVGVTISPKQAARAQQLIINAGLDKRIRCIEADYARLGDDLGLFDLAYAIESFVHALEPAGFFASTARRVRHGGRLIVCDDFCGRAPRNRREEQWLAAIRRGWVMSALMTVEEMSAIARQHGFELVENRDLTSQLELRRPRDLMLSALLLLARPFHPQGTLWRSWMGGDALQHALVARVIEYRFAVFERR